MQKRTTLIFVIVTLFAFLFGWQAGRLQFSQYPTTANSQPPPLQTLADIFQGKDNVDLALFWDVWKRLNDSYVDGDALDNRQRVYGAIKGMVASLDDPYTVFMDPQESKTFDNDLAGDLEGIGAELTIRDGALMVVSPLKNSPSEKAGLFPNDIVYKIDDEVTSDMTLYEAVSKIKGEKGTTVRLTVLRKGNPSPVELSILRDKVHVESVTMKAMDKGIYYITINQFSSTTKTEFQNAISEALLKEPKGFVLDLRYNGGGYLDAAIDVLSELLPPDKEAVLIKRRDGEERDSVSVSGTARVKDVPLAVLVNNGSASASEIVAGAIQDYKRGIVIGEKTFGKGSVQEIQTLRDGSSLRVTIAKWFTPLGRGINEIGIEPDISIPLTEQDAQKGKDPQLDAAVKYLKNLIQ